MGDDFVPEEHFPAYLPLLRALQAASRQRMPITPAEQTDIVAHVRNRLPQAASADPLADGGGVRRPRSFVAHLPAKSASTSQRLVGKVLAALVVVGLILGAWALFTRFPSTHGTPTSGTPASPPLFEAAPTAQVQANGLEASLRILIPGPYFLSELLPIDVSFTNHTSSPAGLGGGMKIVNQSTANTCFPSELLVRITAGDKPSFAFPPYSFGCTALYVGTEIEPGQMLTIHQYVPLTKSGAVTLARGVAVPGDFPVVWPNGRWPAVSVHLQVQPQVPQDRALALHNQQGQVLISAPAGAKAHLLVFQSLTCDGYGGGADQWTPLATTVLREPACPTAHRHWIYVVGAPGYAIVWGSQTA